jgi:osmotically-inducible protein OsmY
VNEKIFWDPRVGTGPVTVAVDRDGDVTLTGIVDTWGEVRAANADAVLAGAAHVTNRLRVAQASAASRSH